MAKISTEFGQSPKFFGREDYLQNLKRGVSSQEMLDFVETNPNLMKGQFQEQVRDEMRQGALREAKRVKNPAKDLQSGTDKDLQSGTDDDYLSQENIGKFQDLLNRLQRSKMEQSQQSARESRKGTFAQGIASMMSNF